MTMQNAYRWRGGQSLVELMTALVCSAFLLAGLGSVMLIARQIAYTPSASTAQLDASKALNELADELRYARVIVEHSNHAIEFVVADRDDDGAAERIRYEWSGTPGDPLYKTVGAAATQILAAVQQFDIVPTIASQTESIATTIESAETMLLGTNVTGTATTGITAVQWLARRIDPAQFPLSIGSINRSDATNWSATRAQFYGRNLVSPHAGFIRVQLRASGNPNDGPTSQLLGNVLIQEVNISSSNAWNIVQFTPAVQSLSLSRRYSLVWEGDTSTLGNATTEQYNHALLLTRSNTSEVGNVMKSTNQGGTWTLTTGASATEPSEIYCQLYGTYSAPGPTYDVTRNRVPQVAVSLHTIGGEHARIDAGIPLLNTPEVLSAYWRLEGDDIAGDPMALDTDGNGDADWELVSGTLQTRPLSDFTSVTIVEARCQATGSGGDVIRINADRKSGLHAPLIVRLQATATTQTLTLSGKPSDAAETTLKTLPNLPNGFVRFRLMIVPQHGVVHLQVNGEDIGGFVYPKYAPSSNDRYLSVFPSNAEFGYVDVRTTTD